MKALILLSLLVFTVAIPVVAVSGGRGPGPQRAVTIFAGFVVLEAILLRFVYPHL